MVHFLPHFRVPKMCLTGDEYGIANYCIDCGERRRPDIKTVTLSLAGADKRM